MTQPPVVVEVGLFSGLVACNTFQALRVSTSTAPAMIINDDLIVYKSRLPDFPTICRNTYNPTDQLHDAPRISQCVDVVTSTEVKIATRREGR